MPDLQYGLTTIDRDRGNFPKVPVINMFVEQIDVEPNPVLQSRPGLENTGTVLGSGPIKTLYQNDGVLSGQLFAISGTHVFSDTSDLGALPGSGPARLAGFQNRLFANAGDDVYEYDGASFTLVTTPSSFKVTSLCIGSDRLIVIDKDTGHFYWSDVLSDNIDTLSFATAENSPDKLKDVLFIGDTLMLFGSETVEFWPNSAVNPDLPWQPLVGRTFQQGIRDTGCCTEFKGSFAWITNHNQICVNDLNTVISTSSLDEKLSQSTAATLWTFWLEGVEFLAVTLDASTWIFNSHSSQWSTFESYGEANWIPCCYTNDVFGSSLDGHLIQWSDDHQDFGDILERRFRAGLPVTTGTVPLMNVTLRTNQGQTPFLVAPYDNPTVELRTSRDGGFTFGTWKDKSLGAQGDYRTSIVWRSLGFFGYPSMLIEIRVTDPVPFRVSGISVNEDYANI